jgi:hypothetical protein
MLVGILLPEKASEDIECRSTSSRSAGEYVRERLDPEAGSRVVVASHKASIIFDRATERMICHRENVRQSGEQAMDRCIVAYHERDFLSQYILLLF